MFGIRVSCGDDAYDAGTGQTWLRSLAQQSYPMSHPRLNPKSRPKHCSCWTPLVTCGARSANGNIIDPTHIGVNLAGLAARGNLCADSRDVGG